MAHADYDCCAICDSKMSYNNGGGETKEQLCAECAVDFALETGEKVTTGDQLVAWISRNDDAKVIAVLKKLGYQRCYYHNAVDGLITMRATQGSPAQPASGEK